MGSCGASVILDSIKLIVFVCVFALCVDEFVMFWAAW